VEPGRLVQLERPEFSVVESYNDVWEVFHSRYHDEFDSDHYSDNPGLNYLRAVYPIPVLVLGRNVCLLLNYQSKYDFTRAFRFHLNRSMALSS